MKAFVVTGGPCAGKTSAMAALGDCFSDAGIAAIFVPEAATDLILEGVAPWTCASMLDFQTRVMALQLVREAEVRERAANLECEPHDEVLVVFDRGICDSHAYLSDSEYEQALAANGLTEADALARYDAVFHLESIAKSDPSAYTRANNEARFENAAEAAQADDRVVDAWHMHSCVRMIRSERDFNGKVAKLADAMLRLSRGTP